MQKRHTSRYLWARLLKHYWGAPFFVCRSRKTNVHFMFPFAANKQKFSISIFCLQQTNRSFPFPFSICRKQTKVAVFHVWNFGNVDMETWRWRHGSMETWRHGDMETWRHGDMETWRHRNMKNMDMETSNRKRKLEAQVIFKNPFTVCKSCKRKFFVCPLVGKETNRSYPFANRLKRLNGLNGLKGLAHLCIHVDQA